MLGTARMRVFGLRLKTTSTSTYMGMRGNDLCVLMARVTSTKNICAASSEAYNYVLSTLYKYSQECIKRGRESIEPHI